jgi:hypothetical protein
MKIYFLVPYLQELIFEKNKYFIDSLFNEIYKYIV